MTRASSSSADRCGWSSLKSRLRTTEVFGDGNGSLRFVITFKPRFSIFTVQIYPILPIYAPFSKYMKWNSTRARDSSKISIRIFYTQYTAAAAVFGLCKMVYLYYVTDTALPLLASRRDFVPLYTAITPGAHCCRIAGSPTCLPSVSRKQRRMWWYSHIGIILFFYYTKRRLRVYQIRKTLMANKIKRRL